MRAGLVTVAAVAGLTIIASDVLLRARVEQCTQARGCTDVVMRVGGACADALQAYTASRLPYRAYLRLAACYRLHAEWAFWGSAFSLACTWVHRGVVAACMVTTGIVLARVWLSQ